MNKKIFYPLFLISSLLFFAGCDDATTIEPTPVAAVTQSPTETSASPTIPPPTATAEPSPTSRPTNTPTPLSVATAPATYTPTPSQTPIPPTASPTTTTYKAKEDAYLEWVLPQSTPSSLISISGGRIGGFAIDGETAFVFMGRTLAIVDMSVEPIGEEISRFQVSGQPTGAVRSGRFLFVRIEGEGVSVFDLTDQANISEAARIKGIGKGTLHLGDNGEVLYQREAGNWLELDVDQVNPAFWLPNTPIVSTTKVDDYDFYNQLFSPHWDAVANQIEEIIPGGTHGFPSGVHLVGNEAYYWTPTRGESGGGQIVRLDVSDPENLKVKSIFRSFQTGNYDVENGFVYTSFLYEIAGGGSQIDVRDPVKPRLDETLVFWANAHTVINNTLVAGDQPGLATFDLTDGLTKLGEFPMAKERPRYPFLDQLVTNPEQTLLFGLTGIYGETGGIAIYSIENPAEPVPLSFIDATQLLEIKYSADHLYFYRTDSTTRSVITVFDVSDPANPKEAKSWLTDKRLIGLEVWEDFYGRPMIAQITPDKISIFDISGPIGNHDLLSEIFSPPECIFEPNRDTYHRHTIVHESWLFAPLGNCPTNRIDISDPANPIILETLDSNGPMIFEDGYLYMGGQNLRIYKFE